MTLVMTLKEIIGLQSILFHWVLWQIGVPASFYNDFLLYVIENLY